MIEISRKRDYQCLERELWKIEGVSHPFIELFVVIAIIAILMAVLIPCLQRVRRQAKLVKGTYVLNQTTTKPIAL